MNLLMRIRNMLFGRTTYRSNLYRPRTNDPQINNPYEHGRRGRWSRRAI